MEALKCTLKHYDRNDFPDDRVYRNAPAPNTPLVKRDGVWMVL